MTLWEKVKGEFIDIIQWTDDTPDTMVYRFPRYDNEIKYNAQLVVRQSQAAVFVNRGKVADVFSPGQYSLTTRNLPVLSTLMGWKHGFHSPFKAEVYFVSLQNFTNLKWGTKNPVILRDPEFGPVRLRSFGTYVVKIVDPEKFIKEITGTRGHFSLDGVVEQLRNLIVSRFSDLLGERKIPVLDLTASYDELSAVLTRIIAPEFLEYGLEITKLLVENISLPVSVEEALDKKSSMGIVGNLDDYFKFQSANAMAAAAENPGGEASAGVGMGMGFAMANQMGQAMMPGQKGFDLPSPAGTPPPLPEQSPEIVYYLAVKGKQLGPLGQNKIIHNIKIGKIKPEMLMWRQGLKTWQRAGEIHELIALFNTTPPPLPGN
ncbi:Membrane protease subunit, stomatin/prohibitin family, contains C-terminal Zn-ribbon domain [Desulfocicer vacuolatum DSM 3385]|uniref:Membrane protease subunit, stomatin/prohibitin family, contains C-terminal Zn-ribbon domain n=1 Tax=Desulfocicer vacuolatum DSM 3385 TaxID=1121400 RepID=A0A1W2A2X0_9BACT|nr:SPFH domain-containing protein [Desulfocicer vacuolatum]SMC55037.1 Membrane protease subunit, stomatin/prohibitin family, contains C-terminal Zn-ribbon domain [Desulfocicer vacuolatum DSM 3385]